MTAPGRDTGSPPSVDGKSVAFYTSIDQVLSSASNALMVFALARTSSVEQFGTIALLVAGASAWIGFNRGALGTPLLLTSNLERHWVVAEAGYALNWALRGGVLAAVVFVGAGAVFSEMGIGLAFALSIPFVLAQDVLRFASIADGRPVIAMISDGAWTGWMLLVFAAGMIDELRPSPYMTIGLWGLGGAISAVAIAVPLRITLRRNRLMEWWRTYVRSRLRFGVVYTMNQVSAFLVALIVTLIIGSVATAGVRGAAALFGPIAMLVSALPMVFVPHARRGEGSPRSQWRLLSIASLITSAITLIIAVGLAFTPAWLGSIVLGDTWAQAAPVIPFIGIECAAMCWIVSVYSFFQARGESRTVLTINVVQIGIQLALCAVAASVIGTAVGVGISLAISGVVITLIGVVFVRLRIRAADAATPDVRRDAVAEANAT